MINCYSAVKRAAKQAWPLKREGEREASFSVFCACGDRKKNWDEYLNCHSDSSGNVHHTDSAVSSIHMLPTRSRRPVGINPHLVHVQIHIHLRPNILIVSGFTQPFQRPLVCTLHTNCKDSFLVQATDFVRLHAWLQSGESMKKPRADLRWTATPMVRAKEWNAIEISYARALKVVADVKKLPPPPAAK